MGSGTEASDVLQSPDGVRIVARLLSSRIRAGLEAALSDGRVRLLERVDLLAPERLQTVARVSLGLLLASGAGFLALDLVVRWLSRAEPLFGSGASALRVVGFVLANTAAYALMVPLHEAVHAVVIICLGGRPRFGLKLPFAAYCTAPGQLFTRAAYTVVALAPLVVLSALGILIICLAPNLGAYLLFGLAGNVAGAVADLDAAHRMRALPPLALIADTATGYAAFLPEEHVPSATA